MRYELFQKVRRRQKEALFIKTSSEVPKPIDPPEEPDDKENDSDTTTEMRNPIARHNQARVVSSHDKPYSREIARNKKVNNTEQRKRADNDPRKMVNEDPTDLADAIRTASKPHHRKGFLPIAMPSPRPLPAVQHDPEFDEYRSEFDAPEHIDVVQVGSHEDARTDVSEITGLTFGTAHRVLPGHLGFHRQPKVHERYVPNIEHVEDVVEVLDARNSRDPRHIKVDVTDLDNIHEAARRVRRELRHPTPRVETRYGLPYESTDFKADDDGSEDSWGVAIVGGHTTLHGMINEPSTPDSPIDAEIFFSESATTARSNKNDVEVIRQRIWKAEMGLSSPKSPASLIKETMSAEGEVVIDLSGIVDEGDFGAVEVSRKSPKRRLPVVANSYPVERAAAPPKPLQVQTSPIPLATPPTPIRQQVGNMAANETLPSPREVPAIVAQAPSPFPKAAPAEPISKATPKDAPSSPDLLEASMNYIKIVAGSITSQLQKIDLLPEQDMSNMLGVLDKDLKATSQSVPETQVVVEFFGEQLRRGACAGGSSALDAAVVEDGSEMCVPTKSIGLNFQSPSVDEMVGVVRSTYQKNLVNCGLDSKVEKPTPAPQTFIVPISLRGFDYESDYISSPEPSDHNSISARQQRRN